MITQAHQAHPELTLQRLCELFEISRSWYYEHLDQPEDDAEEIALRDQIEQIILEFPGYGYRRVTHALSRLGWAVNHKRVLRIMQEESLLCHLKKRFVVTTTNSRHRFPIYPNVLAGIVLTTLDQAWVADLTYIRRRECVCVPGLHSGCIFTPLCWVASFSGDDDAAHPDGVAACDC